MSEWTYLLTLASWLRVRLLTGERGEITEKVISTAIFAALALTAGAIIVTKVTQRANEIPTR